MDSMAVYRRMDIGTAKPTADERARVPHHLIDVVDPSETFDTARWCKLAQARLDELRAAGRKALFVGGTASGSAEKRERLKSSALLRLSELLMNHLNCARSQYLTKMAAREHQSHR